MDSLLILDESPGCEVQLPGSFGLIRVREHVHPLAGVLQVEVIVDGLAVCVDTGLALLNIQVPLEIEFGFSRLIPHAHEKGDVEIILRRLP